MKNVKDPKCTVNAKLIFDTSDSYDVWNDLVDLKDLVQCQGYNDSTRIFISALADFLGYCHENNYTKVKVILEGEKHI